MDVSRGCGNDGWVAVLDMLMGRPLSGSPRDNSNFNHRTWAPLLTRAGVRHGPFHALRHSFASPPINGNQSPRVVQTLLGHHSAAFTMDQYSDVWPQRSKASRMQRPRRFSRAMVAKW